MGSIVVPGGLGSYDPFISHVIGEIANIKGKRHANSLGNASGHQLPILENILGNFMEVNVLCNDPIYLAPVDLPHDQSNTRLNVVFDSTVDYVDEDNPMYQPEVLKHSRTDLLTPEVSIMLIQLV
ncbi:hypothetical protein V6N13_094368 [Hibiscus sabdariffa]|uniref:Uncharacterized protein n=1 Tax=Hibiscus sabdariffa TaxID=183260 RepID=A0ABR2PQ50_9ROSI